VCLIMYTYILLSYCAEKGGVMNVGIDVHGGSCDDARYCEYKFKQNFYLHSCNNTLHSSSLNL
jgi:hypothetical protein